MLTLLTEKPEYKSFEIYISTRATGTYIKTLTVAIL